MAATDFFLVVDTITGESADKTMKSKNAMDIGSFSWGLTNSGSMAATGGGGSGRSSFQDIHFSKAVDKASPSLAQACATGQHIKKATLYVRKAGKEQKEYYTITLEDLLVSSFSAKAGNGDTTVSDEFSLNFAKIKWEYKTQDAAGALGAGSELNYDLKANSTK
jgi:type VI secretion system secreted protein Hcp